MKQDFNFIYSYNTQIKKKPVVVEGQAVPVASGGNRGFVAGAVIAVLAFAAVIGGCVGLNMYDDMQKARLTAELEDPLHIAALQEVGQINNEIDIIRTDQQRINAVETIIKGAYQISGGQLGQIYAALPANVSIRSIGYSRGAITMEVAAGDRNQCNRFANSVQDLGFVQSVTYTGYAVSDETAVFNLLCVLNVQEATAEANNEEANNNG